jgi:hypothetical protein
MVSLRLHFNGLLHNIQPPLNRLEAARTLPRKVRDYLEKHEEFVTLDPHTKLTGSYAQFLTVGDVKDVDFLVRTDGDPKENDPEAKKTVRALKAALDNLPDHLDLEGYTEVEVTGARRSVHVCFPNEDFHIDAVPCIAPYGFGNSIWVPDKGFNKWVESHPLGVVDLVKELEEAYSGKFRNLAKLTKYFRNVQMLRSKPKSYWLLTLLIHEFRDNGFTASDPLPESFHALMDRLYKRLAPIYGRTDGATPNLKDPMLEHNVSWNWGRRDFETFMRRLDDGRRWSQYALDAAANDDLDEAIKHWKLVFGAAFPDDVTELARAEAAARQPGNAAVAASGIILSSATSRTLSVLPTKYYSEPPLE